ncbi:MAG: thioesterase family protein [Sphingomonadaceae bacterium]|nr:thioesterase family protein [Sphingomonadaceae bacterium]
MDVPERVADPSMIQTGLIPCQAVVRVMSDDVLLAQSMNGFTTAWPEANGNVLIPECDVHMDQLADAGTNEDGLALFTAGDGDPIAWRDAHTLPSGEALIGFKRRPLHITMEDRRPGSDKGISTVDRFPRWGDITDLVRLMDAIAQADGVFETPAYGDVRRNVVEGGQLLGDTIVAAAKTDPSKQVVSAQTIFNRPGVFDKPLRLEVNPSRIGRSFTTLTIETSQDGRPIATGAVLMDSGADDLISHHVDFPQVVGPAEAQPYDFGLIGRELRIVNGDYSPDPDRISQPEIHAWMRHREQPEELYLRQAVLAQPTTHWTIAASMLPHKGYGEVMAHRSISTGVLSSTIYFYDDPDLTEWLLYSTRATFAGRGLAQGEGRIFSESGRMIATYSVQVMVRGFEKTATGSGMNDDRLM